MAENFAFDQTGQVMPAMPEPAQGRQSPFAPGTQQTILQWITRLSAVIADLNKAQQAGLNMAAQLMRANTVYQALQRVYQAYYGAIPSH